jgi:VWFA-related protein
LPCHHQREALLLNHDSPFFPRRVVSTAIVITVLTAGLLAFHQDQLPQPVPRFRAGVEAVVIDVSVLDRDRHVVRGLAATDFMILEDGRPQDVHTLKEIDLGRNSRPPEPVWSADHPPDVRRNDEFRDHSVVVIVLDGSTPMAAEDVVRAKEVGAKIIERMEPGDFAAVVHTMDKPAGQDFTQDRDLLRASVKRFNGSSVISSGPSQFFRIPAPGSGGLVVRPVPPEDEVNPVLYRVTLSTLSGVAQTLSTLREQRKTVVFVSRAGHSPSHAVGTRWCLHVAAAFRPHGSARVQA